MVMLLKDIIKEGMRPEWYMGFSWYDPITNTIVAYPIPFNLIMRWLRELYFLVAFPRRTKLEKYMHEALMNKFREGRAEGIALGRSQIYEELRAEYKLQSSRDSVE